MPGRKFGFRARSRGYTSHLVAEDQYIAAIVATLALGASPLAAQATHSATAAKPSMMSRIKAAAQAHNPTAAPVSKPSVAKSNA